MSTPAAMPTQRRPSPLHRARGASLRARAAGVRVSPPNTCAAVLLLLCVGLQLGASEEVTPSSPDSPYGILDSFVGDGHLVQTFVVPQGGSLAVGALLGPILLILAWRRLEHRPSPAAISQVRPYIHHQPGVPLKEVAKRRDRRVRWPVALLPAGEHRDISRRSVQGHHQDARRHDQRVRRAPRAEQVQAALLAPRPAAPVRRGHRLPRGAVAAARAAFAAPAERRAHGRHVVAAGAPVLCRPQRAQPHRLAHTALPRPHQRAKAARALCGPARCGRDHADRSRLRLHGGLAAAELDDAPRQLLGGGRRAQGPRLPARLDHVRRPTRRSATLCSTTTWARRWRARGG